MPINGDILVFSTAYVNPKSVDFTEKSLELIRRGVNTTLLLSISDVICHSVDEYTENPHSSIQEKCTFTFCVMELNK